MVQQDDNLGTLLLKKIDLLKNLANRRYERLICRRITTAEKSIPGIVFVGSAMTLKLLPKLFEQNGIEHVDLFFLDVEGGELTVLETFDWRVRIDVLVVEMDNTNPQKDKAVRKLLYGRGYVTPFSMLDECKKRLAVCLPNQIFVLKEIADRYQFRNATTAATA